MRISARNRQGFTLLELVIVLAVMTILAGVLIPIVKPILDSAKVSKVSSLVDILTSACRKYYKDTHDFAAENGNDTGLLSHQLAFSQSGVSSWNGPYIEGPIVNNMLPFDNSTIELRVGVKGKAGQGYYLTGQGGPLSYSDKGQELVLDKVPLTWADKIDEALDRGIPGSKQTYGRVSYDAQDPTTVYIFILDPFGKTQ